MDLVFKWSNEDASSSNDNHLACFYHHLIPPPDKVSEDGDNEGDGGSDDKSDDDSERSVDESTNSVGCHDNFIAIIPSTKLQERAWAYHSTSTSTRSDHASFPSTSTSSKLPSVSSYYTNVTFQSQCISSMMLLNRNVSVMVRRISPLWDINEPSDPDPAWPSHLSVHGIRCLFHCDMYATQLTAEYDITSMLPTYMHQHSTTNVPTDEAASISLLTSSLSLQSLVCPFRYTYNDSNMHYAGRQCSCGTRHDPSQ
jgi:hypothetical protein